ncbi:hypothetical protein BC937DRAFT_90951 [Endogone sp. FLAS-F59071]|nr:hypothetical protein BC937DRAFT_90951 [Endogone sp. FLAS-F59071]|eukprot:RUS16664.1 hypothetical protein BC937DRAFT_90951 [Endogone sp. FLAS-F59071]
MLVPSFVVFERKHLLNGVCVQRFCETLQGTNPKLDDVSGKIGSFHISARLVLHLTMATNTFDRDREPLDPWRETNPFPELQGPALEVSLAEEGLIADETTSLLANNGTGHDAGWGDEADEQEQRRRVEVHIAGKFSRDMRALGPKEVKTLLLFSAPLVMTNLVQISMRVVDVWFVGHLGPTGT